MSTRVRGVASQGLWLPISQWPPSPCSRYPPGGRAPAASRPPNIAVPYDPDTSPPPCSPVPSRNRHTSFGGLPYAPPVSRTRTCTPSRTSRVVRLTTPPSAAEPYSDEPAPLRISTRSI